MRNVWTIAAATCGETTRRPVYYITLGAFALLVYCSHFITAFAFFQEINMVREMGLASVSLWGFLVFASLTGVLVTQELEDRTAVTLLSKPLTRTAFLLGKYAGLLLAVAYGQIVLTGILFYTLWWMAKGRLFGSPVAAGSFAVAGLLLLAVGLAGWATARGRIRRLEAATARDAPRGPLRAAIVVIVAGAVLLLTAGGFSVGDVGEGDVGHVRQLLDTPEHRQFTRLAKDPATPAAALAAAGAAVQEASSRSVWEFLGSYLTGDGLLVIEGLLLCFLQVAVIGSICVSVSAFAPPVVSVTCTALAFLLGNLSTYMLGSLERLGSPVITFVGHAFYYLLPNLAHYNLQSHFSEGRLISFVYLVLAVLHAGLTTALAFTISCSLFERREIR